MWTNEGEAIYLTADKSEMVGEGDPRARWLLVASGGQLPMDEAEKYGLTGASKAKADAPENKLKAAPPVNKGKG